MLAGPVKSGAYVVSFETPQIRPDGLVGVVKGVRHAVAEVAKRSRIGSATTTQNRSRVPILISL